MKSNVVRSILLLLGSFFLVVSFQNCGQAGSITQVNPETQKISEPLVVDIVDQVDRAPAVKEDIDKSKEDEDCDKDDDKNKEDHDHVADHDKDVHHDDKDKDQNDDVAGDDKKDDVVVDTKKEDVEVVMDAYACIDDDSNSKEKKVMVCHVPPGNPNARHTICISRSALKAHMNHGHKEHEDQDHLGACR